MLSYCLLRWAGQRAPVYLLCTTMPLAMWPRRSALAASFLANFEALGGQKGASNGAGSCGHTMVAAETQGFNALEKDQTAPYTGFGITKGAAAVYLGDPWAAVDGEGCVAGGSRWGAQEHCTVNTAENDSEHGGYDEYHGRWLRVPSSSGRG